MAVQGVAETVAYRIVDNNTGAEIVSDLAHLNRSTWQVRALQQGIPGSTTLGAFRIPLPSTRSEAWATNENQYNAIAKGQRVEGFLGGRIGKTPDFTGVITQPLVRRMRGECEINGMDSLWLAQKSQLYPGEALGAGGSALLLVQLMCGQSQLVWDDDFATSSSPSSLNYNLSGSWTFTSADPQYGAPAIFTTTPFTYAVTKTTWNATSQFNWPSLPHGAAACQITAQGTIVSGTDTVQGASAEILFLSDSTFNNGYMARIVMRQTGASSGFWNIDLEIFTVASGTGTRQAQTANLYQNLTTNVFNFDLKVVLYSLGLTRYVRVLLNGQDPGCVYAFTSAVTPSSGGVGLRAGWTAGGSPAVYFRALRFESRTGSWGTPRFGAGAQTAGSNLPQTIVSSGQSYLDMMLLASTMDGFWIRKVPGSGPFGDAVDYGPSPGQNLTGSVVLDEDYNISDGETGPVSDVYATASRVRAIAGVDTGGSVVISPKGNIGDIVLTDTIVDLGIPGATLQQGYARNAAQRKAGSNIQATWIEIVRTPDVADKFKVLDYLLVHAPTLNIYRQSLQVVGYDFVENSDKMRIAFTQFPLRGLSSNPWSRFSRAIEWLASP